MNLYQHFKTVTIVDMNVLLEDQLKTDKILSEKIEPESMIVRFWKTQGIILGKLDTVLPDFEKGQKVLLKAKQNLLIRKAGGLAVVCDDGILNLSILYSKNTPVIGGLNESYDFGVHLVTHLLQDQHLDLSTGEVSASYCPGKYDLSVNGFKIAGMAQYRSKDAVMVMVTICVTGDQQKRCALIKDFYAAANPQHDPKYPLIDIKSMQTIASIIHKPLLVDDLIENMIGILNKSGIIVKTQKQL
jgi:octanoyl-[GcvH]:protein N-octanoyltransferase